MRAWVLGAGFSVGLGGPLLGDLLSIEALSILRHRHPDTWLSEADNDLLLSVFEEGTARAHWSHAEGFLEAMTSYDTFDEERISNLFLERGGSRESIASGRGGGVTLDGLAARATALIAAQCIDFVERSLSNSTSWLPYDRWARALAPDDMLISFNYDEVVEFAFRRIGRPLSVPNPRLDTYHPPPRRDHVRLLKLHGGVGFRDTIPSPYEPPTVANLMRNPAFIGTPGSWKTSLAEADLDGLWDEAAEALNSAERVFVVGYSCPPSDEPSKALLIDAIRCPVEVVLGPNSPQARRLASLLSGQQTQAVDTGMWAQDYLSLTGRGRGWQTRDWAPDLEDDEADSVR